MSALDFKALLAEEKRKALARLRGGGGKAKASRKGESRNNGAAAAQAETKASTASKPKPKPSRSSAFEEYFARFDAASSEGRGRTLVLGEEHRVDGGKLPSVFYLPEFVSAEEEARLLSSAESATNAWVRLRVRRLQLWGRNPNDGSVAAHTATGAPRPEVGRNYIRFRLVSPRLVSSRLISSQLVVCEYCSSLPSSRR